MNHISEGLNHITVLGAGLAWWLWSPAKYQAGRVPAAGPKPHRFQEWVYK
jgi:hypothetical protein